MDMLRIPQWIKAARNGDDDVPDDTVMLPPPIATLPELPQFSAHDEELSLKQRVAILHAQQQRKIETANVELAEAVLACQGHQQKTAFLEKENAELRLNIAELQNTIATLQSDNLRYESFFSLRLQINEKERAVLTSFGIKAPPKKERKPKAPQPAMQEATPQNSDA